MQNQFNRQRHEHKHANTKHKKVKKKKKKKNMFPLRIELRTFRVSPVENKNDLELDFKVFFFTDSCCSDIVHDESN